MQCWSLETLKAVATIEGQVGKLYALEIYNNLLFGAGSDRTIKA